jgi:hypothetical protein
MSGICPCCGQKVAAKPPTEAMEMVSPLFARMVDLLLKTPGRFVDRERIARHVWAGDPDGGPLNIGPSIRNLVTYNSKKLHAFGWDVEGRLGRYGGHRIVVLQEARK